MKVDGSILVANPRDAAAAAAELERLGYDAGITFEGPHDPFLPLAFAAGATRRLELMTGIAVAFARNPMLLANLGYDLQLASDGRFLLGLGSQIRPHITRRYSMPWSAPVARMRELVLALRAIWSAWETGERLDFRGDFYTHTLMTPIFNPGPSPHGPPPVLLAGVGPRMTEAAGEVADGFLVHPFHTREYIETTTRPALARGLKASGRSAADFQVATQVMLVSGGTDEELERARGAVRAQIAFYASTPAYRGVLECHGRGELQSELNALSKAGRWSEMAGRIDDELLELVCVSGAPHELASRIRERCSPWSDRVSLTAPYRADPAAWTEVVSALQKPVA